jgi:hypothetical protein
MAKKDPRVEGYIKKAQPFARPILKHLRKLVHAGCPNCEESIKWQSPFFDYKGPVCFMAAFKEHAVFGLWKGKLLFGTKHKGAMGHFGPITSVNDLPNDEQLIGYIKKAAALNERGVQPKRAPWYSEGHSAFRSQVGAGEKFESAPDVREFQL